MTQPDPEEMKALFSTIGQKHFSPQDLTLLETRKAHEQVPRADWDALIAEAKTVMARGDAASPAALDVARRWRGFVRQFTDGDPGLTGKVRAFWREALQDPKFVAMSSLTPELLDFMIKAQANLPD